MNLTIERHEFFHQCDGPTLCFSSHWPEGDHPDPAMECGCTKNTDERPTRAPDEVQNITRLTWEFGAITAVYNSFFGGFCLYTKPPRKGRRHGGHDPHFYAWRDGTRIQIEHVGPDENDDREVLLTHLFVGQPEIKHMSTMFNGHSPSRLDLGWVKPETVWLHHCSGGNEATAEITGEEAEMWRVYQDTLYRNAHLLPLSEEQTPLAEMAERTLASGVAALLEQPAWRMAWLFRNLKTSQVWTKGKLIMDAVCESEAQEHAP